MKSFEIRSLNLTSSYKYYGIKPVVDSTLISFFLSLLYLDCFGSKGLGSVRGFKIFTGSASIVVANYIED